MAASSSTPAAAGPLQDPERDQLAETGRQPAQRRGGGKHHDGREQDPLAAEAVTEPAGRGMNTARLTRKAIMKSRKISNQDHLTRNGGGACI
jgi:hypothetical protein